MGECAVSLRPCVSSSEEPVLLAQAGPTHPPDVSPTGTSRTESPPLTSPSQKDLALARKHFERGNKLFGKGDFAKARAEFERALAISGKPKLLFNMAQCHKRLGENREALANFRAYLSALPDASNRKEVEGEISLLEKKLAADETTALAADPTLPPLVPLPLPTRGDESPADHPDPSTGLGRRPPAEPGADGMPPREALVPSPTIPNPQNPPPSYRSLMWTSAAIGVVGLAAGGVGLTLANSREAEYAGLVRRMRADGRITENGGRLVYADSATEAEMRPRMKTLKDEGQMFEGLGWGATISGGAFVGLAMTLWLTEPDQESPVKKREESNPSLSALVDSGTVFVAVERRF